MPPEPQGICTLKSDGRSAEGRDSLEPGVATTSWVALPRSCPRLDEAVICQWRLLTRPVVLESDHIRIPWDYFFKHQIAEPSPSPMYPVLYFSRCLGSLLALNFLILWDFYFLFPFLFFKLADYSWVVLTGRNSGRKYREFPPTPLAPSLGVSHYQLTALE